MNVPFDDDAQSFLDAMQDVKPIAKTDKAQLHDPNSSLEEKKNARRAEIGRAREN
ncbi:Smr/MutS family endonuclease [Alteromonas sp. KUL49]|uniref:Smr/MutS family endonuclease n=1 Tax=Alteromonas sp. KUL49 TaxID=2480798 RepID=UPI0010FFB744|nr:Smr/MutS family endonuclease [Alteromonas sp. KUL49]GEA11625.1 hypothetical protein KUL49_20000 [Alteromonas sp. KUL49]